MGGKDLNAGCLLESDPGEHYGQGEEVRLGREVSQ